jgi:AcrR family transcriptional regulator
MTAEARRRQIVEVALKTIGKYGVQGTTIARIAKAAGVTTAALYTHFENRQAILLAALDEVYEPVFESHRVASAGDPLQRLRDMCLTYARLITAQGASGYARLFLEFVAAAPGRGLREAVLRKEAAVAADLIAVIVEGQQRGVIRADADPEEVALLIGAWAWAGDVAFLMGNRANWSDRASPKLLDLVLDSISRHSP